MASGIWSRLEPALMGGMIGYSTTSGESSLGKAVGDIGGATLGYRLADRLAQRFIPGSSMWAGLGRFGASTLASMGVGSKAGTLLDKHLPLYSKIGDHTGSHHNKQMETMSMNKFAAMAKEAEVRGVLAAFIDGGLMKIASAEEFDALSADVADNLGDTYTIDDVAQVTNALLSGNTKTAEECDHTARMAALGELLTMKVAGEIDETTFVKEAASLQGGWEAAKQLGRYLKGGFSGEKLRAASKANKVHAAQRDLLKGRKQSWKSGPIRATQVDPNVGAELAILPPQKKSYDSGLRQAAAAYGLAGAGLGGAGYLGKSLYDKYRQEQEQDQE